MAAQFEHAQHRERGNWETVFIMSFHIKKQHRGGYDPVAMKLPPLSVMAAVLCMLLTACGDSGSQESGQQSDRSKTTEGAESAASGRPADRQTALAHDPACASLCTPEDSAVPKTRPERIPIQLALDTERSCPSARGAYRSAAQRLARDDMEFAPLSDAEVQALPQGSTYLSTTIKMMPIRDSFGGLTGTCTFLVATYVYREGRVVVEGSSFPRFALPLSGAGFGYVTRDTDFLVDFVAETLRESVEGLYAKAEPPATKTEPSAAEGGSGQEGANVAPAQRAKVPANASETVSGLHYVKLAAGDGPSPSAEDRVSVHYTGRLPDGTLFDSSRSRGTPTSFTVGATIPGWKEALQRMRVGGHWRVWVPAELAYGERGAGESVPPNTDLVFEIELLEIE